jgi:hypothetical protein
LAVFLALWDVNAENSILETSALVNAPWNCEVEVILGVLIDPTVVCTVGLDGGVTLTAIVIL